MNNITFNHLSLPIGFVVKALWVKKYCLLGEL